jgi:uncharacterized protein YcbK (DUF882 family)
MAKLLTANEKTPGAPSGIKNFTYAECEFYDRIPPELIPNTDKLLKNLQVLRDACGKPIQLISVYRSPDRNKIVGGAEKSIHQTGGAADIKVKGMDPKDVAALIEKLIKEGRMVDGGLGIYPRSTPEEGWVHTDVRCVIKVDGFPTARARWNG